MGVEQAKEAECQARLKEEREREAREADAWKSESYEELAFVGFSVF